MTDWNFLTSIPSVLILALVARGFVPFSVQAATPELKLFSRGMLWMIGTFMLRTAYWGTVRGTVIAIDPDAWRAWSEVVNGPDHVNAAFNIGFTIGGIYLLRGFLEMIPDDERHRWSVLTAPFYPGGLCVGRLTRHFSLKWRQR
ncbi:hypothetical protein [Pseudooceanicola atlanticus]|uniref:hypothetical protein n=1 Tax=Pseudooceanicola atlanticus TaxID=1461694 RepID=UPI0023547C22|nr:hypothetical protein [Pseudooceanicola atlanticus]